MTTSRTVQYYASTIHVRSDNVEDVRVLIAKLQVALDAIQEQQRDERVMAWLQAHGVLGTLGNPTPRDLPQALLDKAHQKAFEILDDHGSLRDAVGQAIKLVLAEI